MFPTKWGCVASLVGDRGDPQESSRGFPLSHALPWRTTTPCPLAYMQTMAVLSLGPLAFYMDLVPYVWFSILSNVPLAVGLSLMSCNL